MKHDISVVNLGSKISSRRSKASGDTICKMKCYSSLVSTTVLSTIKPFDTGENVITEAKAFA